MKNQVLYGALIVASLFATSAMAEEVMSKSKLSKLGLSSLKVVDESQGLEVRGKGFATVGGQFAVSNGGFILGPFGFLGAPFPGIGGTAVSLTGTGISGAPFTNTLALTQFGTRHPITQVDSPIVLLNQVTFNGNVATSSAFASGTVFAGGL